MAGQQISPYDKLGLVRPRKGSRYGTRRVWALLSGSLCPFSVCCSSCWWMTFSIPQILHVRSIPGAQLLCPGLSALTLYCPHCGRTTQGSLAIASGTWGILPTGPTPKEYLHHRLTSREQLLLCACTGYIQRGRMAAAGTS